jgi:hypothetical protein
MRALLTDEAFPGHIVSFTEVSPFTFVPITTVEEAPHIKNEDGPLCLKAGNIPPGISSPPAIGPSNPFAIIASSSSKAPSSFERLSKSKTTALEKIGIAALLDLSSPTSHDNKGHERLLPFSNGLSANTLHFDA